MTPGVNLGFQRSAERVREMGREGEGVDVGNDIINRTLRFPSRHFDLLIREFGEVAENRARGRFCPEKFSSAPLYFIRIVRFVPSRSAGIRPFKLLSRAKTSRYEPK